MLGIKSKINVYNDHTKLTVSIRNKKLFRFFFFIRINLEILQKFRKPFKLGIIVGLVDSDGNYELLFNKYPLLRITNKNKKLLKIVKELVEGLSIPCTLKERNGKYILFF